MKTLTCRDLGGPCDAAISGETFEDLAENCKAHVMEAVAAGDAAHLEAIEVMKQKTPEEQQLQFAEFRKHYDAAPEVA